MTHNATTFQTFKSKLLEHLKAKFPHIRHIKYFSDGSGAQYKNYKNFANLCHQIEDHGISCEWNFFATSHGKGPCDGVGGVVKRLATRYSKQLTKSGKDRLLTAYQLYTYAKEQIKNITVFYIPTEEVQAMEAQLASRYEAAKSIPGCRAQHYFVPLSTTSMKVLRVSPLPGQEEVSQGFVTGQANMTQAVTQTSMDVNVGSYCGCLYDGDWYIGVVLDHDKTHDVFNLAFMLQSTASALSFVWPRHEDQCWVERVNILTMIEPPTPTQTGRTYNITRGDHDRIIQGRDRFFSDELALK